MGLSDLAEFVKRLIEVAKNSPPDALAVVLLGTLIVGAGGGWISHRLWSRGGKPPGKTPIDDCPDRLQRAVQDAAELRELMQANQAVIDRMLTHEGQIWRMHLPTPPLEYRTPADVSHAKIVMVANNKGGVGKTTLVMYLAAYFASRNKRVLAIDLDPQASLTKAMLQTGDIVIPNGQEQRLAYVNQLLCDTGPAVWAPEPLRGDLENVHLVTCDQTLEAHETKLQLQWIAKGGQPDVRYLLSRVLLGDKVQNPKNGYDVVLIDAPPRLSLGAINALVACTHLLVPTKLDTISAETVSNYLTLVSDLRDGRDGHKGLNPGLQLAGVVATMTSEKPLDQPLTEAEKEARTIAAKGMENWRGDHYIFTRDVQDRGTIRQEAGKRLVRTGVVPSMFDKLGAELSRRLKLA